MAGQNGSWLAMLTAVARGILHSRELRRKMMFQLLLLFMGLVVLGVWPMADWLDDGLGRFLLWWAGVMAYGGMVILLAIYDLLMVWKEDR